MKPQTNPDFKFREESTSLVGLYIHDDRLGPYAFAQLSPFTDIKTGAIRTSVYINWPDRTPGEYWLLHAVVVPVPQKLRLSLTRMRKIGLIVAEAIGQALNDRTTTLNCRYELARKYGTRAYQFGLSEEGIYKLACQTPLSRFLGVIEIRNEAGPIVDVLLDTTEANPEPAVLACVKRSAMPAAGAVVLGSIAKLLGAGPIF